MAAYLPNPWLGPPPAPPVKTSSELNLYTAIFGLVAAIASLSTVFLYQLTGYATTGEGNSTTEYCKALALPYADGKITMREAAFIVASMVTHLGLAFHHGNGASRSWALAGPHGAGSTMAAFWVNLVTGGLFAYVIKEESRIFLWFMLSLNCWFFALSRILKPRFDFGIQKALLGFTLGKVVTLPGYDGSRAAVFIFCLMIGTARPWLEKYEDGRSRRNS